VYSVTSKRPFAFEIQVGHIQNLIIAFFFPNRVVDRFLAEHIWCSQTTTNQLNPGSTPST